MKTIYIHAYAHFNLGDDLFIRILCERYPSTRFVLLADKQYQTTFNDLTNLKIHAHSTITERIWNRISRRSMRLLSNCDGIVYIGGSLFIEQEGWQKVLHVLNNYIQTKKPLFLLGANFGPFHSKLFYERHLNAFKQVTDICFRDQYSYALFKKQLPNVRIASDIVLQFQPTSSKKISKQIIISVIDPASRPNLKDTADLYYNKIVEIILYLIEAKYQIVLASFCAYEHDEIAITEILKRIDSQKIHYINTFFYRGDMRAFTQLLASAQGIVATRLHAMILGWVFNKPVYPIVYSSKMTQVISDMEIQTAYTEMKDLHSLKPEDVFNSLLQNPANIGEHIINSQNQFQALDKYLDDAPM